MRWGFLDDMLPVDWALPGEPHFHEILERAREAGAPVELVVGAAPGWADPWSRARRGAILEVVPEEISRRCKVGWTISGVVGRLGKRWQIVEAWNVYPG